MRRQIRLSLLVVLLVLPGCASTPSGLTPAGVTAFNSHRLQDALDVVRNIAQSAATQSPPVVSQDTANTVTRWHLSAITIIHSAASGWQATLTTSLDELLKALPAADAALLRPYVTLAKTIIQEVIR